MRTGKKKLWFLTFNLFKINKRGKKEFIYWDGDWLGTRKTTELCEEGMPALLGQLHSTCTMFIIKLQNKVENKNCLYTSM